MTSAPKPDARRKLLAALHAEAKRHGMDDDVRRGLILKITGKASSAALTPSELGKVLDAIKGRAGANAAPVRGRALADSPHARKIRALWLSLWNLGAVDSPSEEALAAFAERQCGVQALQWVRPAEASRIIEALRGMCRRHGFDVAPGATRESAEWTLFYAQQRRLAELGWDIPIEPPGGVSMSALTRQLGEIIRNHGIMKS